MYWVAVRIKGSDKQLIPKYFLPLCPECKQKAACLRSLPRKTKKSTVQQVLEDNVDGSSFESDWSNDPGPCPMEEEPGIRLGLGA